MVQCQAEDCPAPKIDYENLNSLSDSKLVCPFCFTRLNASEKTYNKIRMIDAPSQGLTRIPSTKKGFLDSKNIDKQGSIIIKSPKSKEEEIYKWHTLLQSLKDLVDLQSVKIEFITMINSELKPILLKCENLSIIIFLKEKNTNSLISSLEGILSLFFPLSIREPIRIDLENLSRFNQDLILEYWEFLEKTSFHEYFIYFLILNKRIFPLKELIDHPEYSKVNLSILIKELSIIWVLLMIGYENILDSLMMEFYNDTRGFAIIFLGNENFRKISFLDSEKKIFRDFALYLPFLLDEFEIFREEGLHIKSEIERKLVEPNFKQLINQIFQDGKVDFPIFEY